MPDGERSVLRDDGLGDEPVDADVAVAGHAGLVAPVARTVRDGHRTVLAVEATTGLIDDEDLTRAVGSDAARERDGLRLGETELHGGADDGAGLGGVLLHDILQCV